MSRNGTKRKDRLFTAKLECIYIKTSSGLVQMWEEVEFNGNYKAKTSSAFVEYWKCRDGNVFIIR